MNLSEKASLNSFRSEPPEKACDKLPTPSMCAGYVY